MANIQEYKEGPMPDWVQEGKPVAVVHGYYSSQQVTIETVKRVTPTQVTVGIDKYNLKRNLKRIGHTSSWSSAAYLADPEDSQVKLALMEKNVANAKYLVGKFAVEFAKDSTIQSAGDLVKAVEIWRQRSAMLAEFAESVKAEA